MKINVMKAVIVVIGAAVASYLRELLAPLLVLLGAMALDYATGLVKAYISGQLSSQVGLAGILKKLCYMAMVAVGAGVDYLLSAVLAEAGIAEERTLFCGLLVAIWLIINELISVLENLAAIGVPGFPFLTKLLERLKGTVETAHK